jgi:lipopolysaccharide/colanic/teichoic acid biosynthesis glycosyltransferase
MYVSSSKRGFDLFVAAIALWMLAPVMAIVALLVRLKLGSPVLFHQQRPGLHGEIFIIHKFRTMRAARDASEGVGSDEERLTGFGRFLRSTSLDELPELFNVVRGDMSLVGPRPLLVQYLERYTPHQMRRHEVRPGITGLAQVYGRNALTWEEKFALDVRYVEQVSWRLDLALLRRTLAQIVRRDGISQPGSATAQEFMGGTASQ